METTFTAGRPLSPALPKALQCLPAFSLNKHFIPSHLLSSPSLLQAGHVASDCCHSDAQGESLRAEAKVMGTHEQLMLQVKAANNAEDKEESAPAAQFLLDMVCNLYHSKQAKYTDSQRYEKLRYDMLIAAIDGALPMHNSAMVSSNEGCSHLDLMSSRVIVCSDICVTAR